MNIFLDVKVYKNIFFVCLKKNKEYLMFKDLKTLQDDLKKVIQKGDTIIGVNIISFHLPLLILAMGGEHWEEELNKLYIKKLKYDNDYIIRGGKNNERDPIVQELGMSVFNSIYENIVKVFGCSYQDLNIFIKDMSLDRYMAQIHFEKLINLPYDITKNLEESNIADLLDHSINIINVTEHLYKTKLKDITNRNVIKSEYGVSVKHKADSSMGEVILKRLVPDLVPRSRDAGEPVVFFRDSRFNDIIKEDLPTDLKNILNRLLTSDTINDLLSEGVKSTHGTTGNSFHKMIRINKGIYKMAKGGLHSVHDVNKIYISTDKFTFIDIDVASFYPNIIMGYQISKDEEERVLKILKTRSGILHPEVVRFLKDRFKKRLEYKKEGNVQFSNVEKLIMNSVFGKFLYPYGCLYDPSSAYSTTLGGQIWLLYLIHKFEDEGIPVLSANTDGLLLKVTHDKMELFQSVLKKWEDFSKFQLEVNEMNGIYIKDVNNYFAHSKKGEVKRKGIFGEINESGGSQPNIISRLAELKLMNNSLDLNEEIKNHNDIRDYLFIRSSERGGSITWNGVDYGSTVRFIKTKNNIPLLKSETKNQISDSEYAYPIVDLSKGFEHINKDYYVKEAMNIYDNFDIDIFIEIYENSKIPVRQEWQTTKMSDTIRDGYNVGMLIKDFELVVDVDPKADPEAIIKSEEFMEYLGIDYFYNVETPSGGRHIYLKLPEKIEFSKFLPFRYGKGLEFKYKGSQVLVPPSIINGKRYKKITDLKYKLTKSQCTKLRKLFPKKDKTQDDLFAEDYYSVNYKKLRAGLMSVDPAKTTYEEWLNVGMGLHDHFDGGAKGVKLWDDWSKSGTDQDRYKVGDCEKRYYNYFSYNRNNKITLGTVFYMIEKYGKKEKEKPTTDFNEVFKDDKFLFDWVYYDAIKKYVSLKDGSQLHKEGFSNEISPLLSVNQKKTKKGMISVFDFMNKNYYKHPVVRGLVYDPTTNERIIRNADGQQVLNTFKESSLPKPAKEYTMKGTKYINILNHHLDLISGNKGDLLKNYVAHIMQRRGQKIGWFIMLISDVRGIGKTFFIKMIFEMLGSKNNAKLLTGDDFKDNFTAWIDGKMCLLCSEFYTKHWNREDVMDTLRPVITDDVVQVHVKYKDRTDINSYCNGIFACNDIKELGNLEKDRRWCVFLPPILTESDLAKAIFETLGDDLSIIGVYDAKFSDNPKKHLDIIDKYYYYLVTQVSKFLPQIIKMFMEVEIPDDFPKRAPLTEAKGYIIKNKQGNITGLTELIAITNRYKNSKINSIFCNDDYITPIIFDTFKREHSDIIVSNNDQKKLRDLLDYKYEGPRISLNKGDEKIRLKTYFKKILAEKDRDIIIKTHKEKYYENIRDFKKSGVEQR